MNPWVDGLQRVLFLGSALNDEYRDTLTEHLILPSFAIVDFEQLNVSWVSSLDIITFLTSITASLCHICASITLSLFVLEHWQCHDFWYIFGFCR